MAIEYNAGLENNAISEGAMASSINLECVFNPLSGLVSLLKIVFKRLLFGLIFVLLFHANSLAAEPEQITNNRSSVGFGFGLAYGGLGFHAQYPANEKLNWGVGVGYLPLVGGLINASARYTLGRLNHRLQPRATVLLGHNSINDYHCENIGCTLFESKRYLGVSAGLGFALKLGAQRRHALEIDVVYRVYSAELSKDYKNVRDSFSGTDKPINWTPSIGYRYYF